MKKTAVIHISSKEESQQRRIIDKINRILIVDDETGFIYAINNVDEGWIDLTQDYISHE